MSQQKAEETLRNAEKLLRSLADASLDAIYVKDRNRRWLFANPALERIKGKPAAELLGKTDDEIYSNSEIGRAILEHDTKVLESGKPETFEEFIDLSDGRHYFISVKSPFFDEYGNLAGLVGISHDITPRKRREEQLRISQKKYKDLIETTSDFVWEIDPDGRYTYCSPQMEKLWKLKPAEMIGKTPFDQMPSEVKEEGMRFYKSVVASKKPFNGVQVPSLDGEGNLIFIEISGVPFFDDKGELLGYRGITRDITKHKKAEEALKQSEAHYRRLFDNIEDGFQLVEVIRDEKGKAYDFRYLEVNSAYEKQTGMKASQVLGKLTSQAVPNFERSWLDVLGEIEETGKPAKFENFGKANGRFYQTFAFKFAKNQVGVFFKDITQSKKAEDTLKENERLYRTVFDNSQDGFQLIQLIYDKHGRPVDHKFLEVNKAYEKIIGVKAEQIIDKTARAISPNAEPYWFEIPDQVIKTGQSQHVEIYNKDINKWLDCYYFPYSKDTAGTLFRDITERINLQKQLQDKERLAAIGQTAGMVGHDIRNPLQAIASDTYLMKLDMKAMPESEEKESMKESIDSIEKNVDYINKIVQDLQDYAKILNPEPAEVNLKTIINELLKKNSIPKNIKTIVKVEPDVEKVITDASFMQRILANLESNAIQAMPNGGILKIDVYREKQDTVLVVEDSGLGIPEEVKPKLFTPLFTTKSKGQGFGLAVVKRMTEACGGTVTFESEKGKGTKFIIRLPPKK